MYYRGPDYFELDLDISSSAIAQRVVGIAGGYAKMLTVDMVLVLQGDSVDELPEVPFGAMRIIGIDFNTAPHHPPLAAPVPLTGHGGHGDGVPDEPGGRQAS